MSNDTLSSHETPIHDNAAKENLTPAEHPASPTPTLSSDTNSSLSKPKVPKKPSSHLWYAFMTDKVSHSPLIVSAKSQSELKNQLKDLAAKNDVHHIVKGKAYTFTVQKSFVFNDAVEVEATP